MNVPCGIKFCKTLSGTLSLFLSVSGELLSGVVLDSRYEIKCLVKTGSMCSIYEALDHRFSGQCFAIKEMLVQSISQAEQQLYVYD